ncbi:Myosin light chain kinase family member 4 [Nymphon striatum]|nr:Myosin light chain kinase family member 4 [Nymphon striatum]
MEQMLRELSGELKGEGKFGIVYKCNEKSTGRVLAAKFVVTTQPQDRNDVIREVQIMQDLQHPRLLQLYDAFDDGGKKMCLVLELIEGGELFERVIDDDFILTEKACSIFLKQICEGVGFMHSRKVLHLDMKPENVLCVSRTGNRIKLIDFGLARRFDPKKKLQVLFGTPEFAAPEVVNFDSIGYKTDIWSIGVITYVLLSGLSPFMGDTDCETMANVTRGEFDFDDDSFDDISDEAKDFIEKVLVKKQRLIDD